MKAASARIVYKITMMRRSFLLIGFILLKFLLQYFLISPEYDLHRDEYLHLDQGQHLAWGYLSVPPVTSWISSLIYLLGNTEFWVKFFPGLFGALTILVVWKAIENLNGNLFALTLGATSVLFSALLRLNLLYQPNSLDVLCWTTFYFLLIKYMNTEKPRWLYVGAVIFAIGFLNKYNVVFLFLGLLPAILLTEQRRILTKKNFYLALLLGLVLIFPNLWWQYVNQFPVVHHLKQLADTQLVNVDRGDFLKSQLLFFAGSLVVILSGLLALWVYKPFKKYSAFFWSLIFTLLAFMYFRAKDYYAIGLYPIYIAFGSVFLADLLKAGKATYLKPVTIALPILFFIPAYDVFFPTKSPEYISENGEKYKELGALRWEDGKDHVLPQDFADMLGWKELAYKVDKVYSGLPESGETLVLCDNYGQAGAINFYTKQAIKAASFSADYLNWFTLDRQYVNLIRIKSEDRDQELEETSPYFNSSFVADSIANPFAREYGTTIFVFTGAKVDVNERIKMEIDEKKRYMLGFQ